MPGLFLHSQKKKVQSCHWGNSLRYIV